MLVTPEIEAKWEKEYEIELLELQVEILQEELENKHNYICELLGYIDYLEGKIK